MAGQIPEIFNPEVYLNTFFPNARTVTENINGGAAWSLSHNKALPSVGYRTLSKWSVEDHYEIYGFSGRFFHTETGVKNMGGSSLLMRPANPAEIIGLLFATMRDLPDSEIAERLKIDASIEISEMSKAFGWISLVSVQDA